MPILGYVLTVVVAYLLGSIPTGFLVAKARGKDIRTVGSGNIGATNVFRALGTPAGLQRAPGRFGSPIGRSVRPGESANEFESIPEGAEHSHDQGPHRGARPGVQAGYLHH